MPEDYDLYVGVDWGTEAHQVYLMNPTGRHLGERRVPHSGVGLTALVADLARQVPRADRIAVAIETPHGAVVDALLAHGCDVFAVNPKQLDRFRDRHAVAGAKDDRRDAFVLADALRTDRWAFRRLQANDPRLIQLREISHVQMELVQELTRLTNRLREQLLRFYPQALTLCPAADEPWLWSLLERAATPAQARGVRVNALRALLAEHRIRRFPAEALHAALQAAALPATVGTVAAAAEHVSFLLPRLRMLHEQRVRSEHRLERLLDALAQAGEAGQPEHRDVTILRSVPGVGRVVAATMLAEAWQPLATRDYQTLRAHAGVAPVTRQSGKTRLVSMRQSCNHRLRQAVFHWAANSLRLDQRCRAQYDRLRQRHGHARALRGVADRLLAMLIAMLATGKLYDSSRRYSVEA
jgi:transposase